MVSGWLLRVQQYCGACSGQALVLLHPAWASELWSCFSKQASPCLRSILYQETKATMCPLHAIIP